MNWWHLLHDYIKKITKMAVIIKTTIFRIHPLLPPRIAPPRHRAVIII